MDIEQAINFLKYLGHPEQKVKKHVNEISSFWEKHVKHELRNKLNEKEGI